MRRISFHTVLILFTLNSASVSEPTYMAYLSLDQVKNTQRFGDHNWRYHAGDDTAWARPDFDDNEWELARTELHTDNMPKSGWQGRGWFRLHLDVDSSLWHEPVMFLIYQAGSSRIYCDGKLIYDYSTSNDSAYRSFVSMTLDEGARHVIAVRYENESTQYFHTAGRVAGFYFAVGLPDVVLERSETSVRTNTAMQMFFTAMALVFAMLHFTLFWFSPKADRKRIARNNLYFSLFALFTAANVFFDYQHGLVPDMRGHVFFLRIHRAALPFGNIFALLFIYSLFEERIPRQFWIFTAALLLSGAFAIIKPIDNLGYVQLIGVVATAEFVRVIGRAIKQKRDGVWTITFGFMLLFVFSVYDLLVDQQVIKQVGEIRNGYPAGFLGLFTCMSMYLARDFARANQTILYQEHLAKEKEFERKLLEADNARKTKELDDARQVQLSMLPKHIPSLPHLDIAVEMNTATEVGGDYYDFHLADDGTLTIALGDATGHGMKAGTMVSVAKALFHELATQPNIPTIFERFTRGIKSMNFSQLYMSLMLVRIKNHSLEASSAGMPPMLVFRTATQRVEVVTMKGMPLGGFERFPYQSRELQLECGDTLLLMSDGFLEMFNEEGETLDESRAVAAFKHVADRNPKEIIESLIREGKKWANGRPQADDVTFVAMKVK